MTPRFPQLKWMLSIALLLVFLAACQAPRQPVVDTDHTLTVAVDGTGAGTVTSVPEGITVTSGDDPAAVDFPADTQVTLTATPVTGSVFTGWSGDCTGTGTCALTMDGDKNVVATFALAADVPQRSLEVAITGAGTGTVTSTPEGIDVTSGGDPATGDFASGTQVTLTAVPAAGSAFSGWTGDCSGTDPCVLTMDADKNVVATFALVDDETQHTLAVSIDGTGVGTVTSNPDGIDVTSGDEAVAVDFAADSLVTLNPTPAAGSVFAGWNGDCTGTGACVVVMNEDRSVTATFEPAAADSFTLRVDKIGNGIGTISSDPSGIDMPPLVTTDSATFGVGAEVTLTAIPEAGSGFAGWSGGECSGTGTCVVTLDADTTVEAWFFIAADVTISTSTIVAGSDDAQEHVDFVSEGYPAGSVYTTSSDIDLAFDTATNAAGGPRGPVVTGLRYASVTIPKGAIITSAIITFRRDGNNAVAAGPGSFTLVFAGQDEDDAPTFVDTRDDAGPLLGISGRPRTDASVDWAVTGNWGATVPSPNLASIVQQIVDRDGWVSGNAVAFTITSPDSDANNHRRARSFEAGDPPVLRIEYLLPPTP
jgi:hypothetical protein